MTTNIAIFASGSGSNAERIIHYFAERSEVNICLIVANRKDAFVLERAKKLNVPSVVFPREEWATGDNVLSVLHTYNIDFIVLAGFLARVPELLLDEFPNRIINIHPALLPKHGGKGMYGDRVHRAVLEAGEKETGITVHYINKEYDEGQVILQAHCPVLPEDTPEDIAARVHKLEYAYYPIVVETLISQLRFH